MDKKERKQYREMVKKHQLASYIAKPDPVNQGDADQTILDSEILETQQRIHNLKMQRGML